MYIVLSICTYRQQYYIIHIYRKKLVIHLGRAEISPHKQSLPHSAAPRAQLVPHVDLLRVVQAAKGPWRGSGRYLKKYGKLSIL